MRKILNHIARNKRWYLIGCAAATLMCFFLPISSFLDTRGYLFQVFTMTFSFRLIAIILFMLINISILILLSFKKSIYFSFLNIANILILIDYAKEFITYKNIVLPSFAFFLILFFTIMSYPILFLKEKVIPLSKKEIIANLEKRIEELEKDREQK